MKQRILLAIIGRAKDTVNYETAFRQLEVNCFTTLNMQDASAATHLLLPGGGDITPALFGQTNHGSYHIDTELDLLQFQALETFIASGKPVLGICKGLQLINVHFGGTITQHIDTADQHRWVGKDQLHYVYHSSLSRLDFFYQLYGNSTLVNSAHHQAIEHPGDHLIPVCRAGDNVIEGLMHDSLPILAVQWHPERILKSGGDILLQYFLSLTAL